MPLYEYKCARCGTVFEVIQKFVDAPLTEHEACGGALERLVSTSALQFKGSGWYVNDYAKGGSGGRKSGDNGETKRASDGDKSSDKGGDKSSEKSTSKPAETSSPSASTSSSTPSTPKTTDK